MAARFKDTSDGVGSGTLPDTEMDGDDDLWFMPPRDAEIEEPVNVPWTVASRETGYAPEDWIRAEAVNFKLLVSAAETAARYFEKLSAQEDMFRHRLALMSVSSILRDEGVWIAPEDIALWQSLRLNSADNTRDLARASWAVRRLIAGSSDIFQNVAAFLGGDLLDGGKPEAGEARLHDEGLAITGGKIRREVADLDACHSLTRAAFAFAVWRREGVSEWDDLLEPTVAALILSRDGAGALPMAQGHRLDRQVMSQTAPAERRLRVFYSAARAGALSGLAEIDRLNAWAARAREATQDLQGRIPGALIPVLIRFPVLSVELAAQATGGSHPAVRRNLNLFREMGLIREVTGQSRYRFWAI